MLFRSREVIRKASEEHQDTSEGSPPSMVSVTRFRLRMPDRLTKLNVLDLVICKEPHTPKKPTKTHVPEFPKFKMEQVTPGEFMEIFTQHRLRLRYFAWHRLEGHGGNGCILSACLTCKGHTTCILMREDETFCIFDSMPSSMRFGLTREDVEGYIHGVLRTCTCKMIDTTIFYDKLQVLALKVDRTHAHTHTHMHTLTHDSVVATGCT